MREVLWICLVVGAGLAGSGCSPESSRGDGRAAADQGAGDGTASGEALAETERETTERETAEAEGEMAAVEQPESPVRPTVLVFSRTAGFRHDSIPAGIAAVEALGASEGFDVVATEDPGVFTDEGLAGFAAVVFLSTTGDVLDSEQEGAFERFVALGRGYVGVHAAADTEYDWAWYGGLVGAYFKGHPPVQEAVVLVTDREHPSTSGLPERWTRRDEWYDYRDTPRERDGAGVAVDGRIRILATLLEETYEGGSMGADHPIAWCQEYGGGRSWYTGGGHTIESFAEPEFLEHLAGGIRWAMGEAE